MAHFKPKLEPSVYMEPIVDAQQKTCFQQLRLSSAFEDKCNSSYSCSMSEACSSVAHQCDSRCGWLEKDQPAQVERELISGNTTVFEHNWNNNKYCFNVYCMSIAL